MPGCGGSAPPPFRAPPNDCGAKEYSVRNAPFRADVRRGFQTLERVTETSGPLSSGLFSAMVIDVVPLGLLYQKCKTSSFAPAFPAFMGMIVRQADVNALRNLKPGERHRVQRSWSGDCKDDLPEEAACRFKLDIHVDIRRWRPGERFP